MLSFQYLGFDFAVGQPENERMPVVDNVYHIISYYQLVIIILYRYLYSCVSFVRLVDDN